jgi:hypothetical protein
MKAIALPFGPPSSISWRARSAPIERRAASAAEKNAVAIKQIMRRIISNDVLESSKGGSMDRSLLIRYSKINRIELLFYIRA